MALTLKMHRKQQEILNHPARHKLLHCGRRFGKTYLAMIAAILEVSKPNKRIGWVAPRYQFLIPVMQEFQDILHEHIRSFNRNLTLIKLKNGSTIEFFSTEQKAVGRGRKFHLLILDEAAYIKDYKRIWNANLVPCLIDYSGRSLHMSTPQGINYFHDLSQMQETAPDWKTFAGSVFDNIFLPESELALYRGQDDPWSRQELFGDFIADNICPMGAEALNGCTQPYSTNPTAVYAIDLASMQDFTVIIGLDRQCQMTSFSKTQKQNYNDIFEQILKTVGNKPAIVDASSLGKPMLDFLQKHNGQIEGFIFNQSTKKDLLHNLIWYVNNRKCSFNAETKEELERFIIKTTNNYQRYEVSSGHDDCAMALALGCWWHSRQGEYIPKEGAGLMSIIYEGQGFNANVFIIGNNVNISWRDAYNRQQDHSFDKHRVGSLHNLADAINEHQGWNAIALTDGKAVELGPTNKNCKGHKVILTREKK